MSGMTKRDLWAIWDPEKAAEQMKTESPLMESCETVANWLIGNMQTRIDQTTELIVRYQVSGIYFNSIIEEL